MSILINDEKLQQAIEWFAKYVVCEQKGGKVDFYAGFMQEQEGYKKDIYKNAHKSLKLEAWDKEKIGTGYIEACVHVAFNAKAKDGTNNIVVYQNVSKFHERALENMAIAEDILYRLYFDADPQDAFEEALKFWGKWYPEFSYLMFIRDCEKYITVKTNNHIDRFKKLGISTECLQVCSWKNYKEFISIHRFIQKELAAIFDQNISLLDAHSFVWQLYNAPVDFVFKQESKLATIAGGTEFVKKIVENRDYSKLAEQEKSDIEEAKELSVVDGEEREVFIKHRVNQGVFRNRLLNRYNHCCLCKVSNPALLVASHIQPWSQCEKKDRLVVDNGLLLCPNHDALFDKGLITFEEDGSIRISEELQMVDRIFMNVNEDMKIEVRDGMKKYLRYHRENIFHSRRLEQ